jgi:hypothetical protein
LTKKIENLKDGWEDNFPIIGVNGWVLAGWSKEFISESRPDKCFYNSCLCVCKDGLGSCQDNGLCREIGEDVVQFSTAEGVFDKGEISKKWKGIPDNIDAVFESSNAETYFFKGKNSFELRRDQVGLKGDINELGWEEYFKSTVNDYKVKNTKDISKRYPGMPDDVVKIDAAFRGFQNDYRFIYFFTGDKYYKYDGSNNKLIHGPTSISGWKGLNVNSIDGVYHTSVPVSNKKGITYFFSGDRYYRYDDEADRVVKVAKISENWPGIPDGIDGVIATNDLGIDSQKDKIDIGLHVYFFKDNMYYLYVYLDKGSKYKGKDNKIALKNKLYEVKVKKNNNELFFDFSS